ncbi:PsbP-related protein [Ruminiclostridium cellobioparum]|uniref:PsbP-related protein n=1 Tax=Ruminiclostridium cellobioparum TaxID=29355 RepID=UPI000488C6F3|nr:PsbP-related protein [Ruminiclostridium cellobioparum]
MNIIIISNYKRKLLIIFTVVTLWILFIIAAGHLYYSKVQYTLYINSNVSLSYPSTISIKNVYSKYSDSAPYIQASNTNYKNFIEFKSQEEGFEFSYPSIFKLNQQNFPGSEILYHIDFQNKEDRKFYGFVQVWNMPQTLEQFLEASKEAATTEFINFTSKKVKVNGLNGYFWEYTVDSADEKYKALEVFLAKGSRFYRISYYMPEKDYGKNDYDMFWRMVESFKIG